MVWPAVRVPNIPPGDKFFFFYSKMGASKPDRVAYLQPGKFVCKKSKQGATIGLRFEAPLVMKGKKFGKELKFLLGATDQKERDKWMQAFTTSDVEEDEAHALLHEHAKDAVSHYDFEVTVKKKVATLTVTKETLKVFQKGKLIESYNIKDIKSWSVGPDKMVFKLNAGGTIEIETKQGPGIKDALVNQAQQMIQEKKDAKAAKAAAIAKAEEEAKMKAAEVAEEALRWLTHEELRTGNYERYTAAGSRQGEIDEKNKEVLMTDEEFTKVRDSFIGLRQLACRRYHSSQPLEPLSALTALDDLCVVAVAMPRCAERSLRTIITNV
jgi:hypothetical protein